MSNYLEYFEMGVLWSILLISVSFSSVGTNVSRETLFLPRKEASQFLLNYDRQRRQEVFIAIYGELYETSEICNPTTRQTQLDCDQICDKKFDCFLSSVELMHKGLNGSELDHIASNTCFTMVCSDQVNSYICYCDQGWDSRNSAIIMLHHQGLQLYHKTGSSMGSNRPGEAVTTTKHPIKFVQCTYENCQESGLLCDPTSEYVDRHWADTDCPSGYACALPRPCPQNLKTECVRIDECLSRPCLHGHCEDGIFSYTCLCEDGWTGVNCEIEEEKNTETERDW